tara:strand:- start:1312 stop:1659 length:348 start_codon:yes stop_codon:yes gene_type:complete
MYFTVRQFSEIIHIAECTISSRVSNGIMPKPDSMQEPSRGRPGSLWRESTVMNYKNQVSSKLYFYTTKYSLRKSAEMCGIKEKQARRLLLDFKGQGKKTTGFELFIKVSSRLGAN